jgi:hypothetical protein
MTTLLINVGFVVFLNPIVVMSYIAYFRDNEKAFEQVGTNSYRLLLTPYLVACVFVGVFHLGLMYFFHSSFSNRAISVRLFTPPAKCN